MMGPSIEKYQLPLTDREAKLLARLLEISSLEPTQFTTHQVEHLRHMKSTAKKVGIQAFPPNFLADTYLPHKLAEYQL